MTAFFTRFQITFTAAFDTWFYFLNVFEPGVADVVTDRNFDEARFLRHKVHHTDAPFHIELNRALAGDKPR